MTINERFEQIIKILFNGNKRAFAKAVGISPTVVENIVGARKGKPSYDVLFKVCSNANISAEWILFGNGDELLTEVFNPRKDLVLRGSDDSEYSAEESASEDEAEQEQLNVDNKGVVDYLSAQIKEKEMEIGSLHEEIGRLKERNAQLQHRNTELETELSRGLHPQTDSREFTPQYESQKV